MKNSVLFIAILLLTGIMYGQPNYYPPTGPVGIGTINPDGQLTIDPPLNNDSAFLRMGESVDEYGRRYFNFASSYLGTGYVGYTIYGYNNKLRYTFSTSGTDTYLGMNDPNGNEVFKVLGTTSSAYIHLPKADSKVVIGGYASYLDSEGHMFIVKGGSAKIEGDIITNDHIGIGTDLFIDGLTEYKLSVNGKIRANAIKVYSTWADFVFESDYELAPLHEVEQFIETNGHLKDIPSAKEVEEEGIDLGEMNKLLLQKVEELTLYVIDLNKQIEVLNEKQ